MIKPQQPANNMNIKTTKNAIIVFTSLFLLLGVLSSVAANSTYVRRYAPGFVPLYKEKKRDEISEILNMSQAERVVPVIIGKEMQADVYINGEIYHVQEPFDDFMERVTRAFNQ